MLSNRICEEDNQSDSFRHCVTSDAIVDWTGLD